MGSNKKTISGNYAGLVELAISVLNFSYSEIKEKYTKYPLCLFNYMEKGVEDKYLEIRFDDDGVTLSCNFDADDTCDFVYLFADSDEQIEDIILYFKENYAYDFVNKRWSVLRYYIKVKEKEYAKDEMCLAFFKQYL